MHQAPLNSVEVMEALVGYPTIARTSNLELLTYVEGLFAGTGARCERVFGPKGDRANLLISVGPREGSGIILSGHSDVVPVEGQPWASDPFKVREDQGLLYGRGTADMKGFLACAIRMVHTASQRDLSVPLHLAISFDEEVGCLGVRPLLDHLKATRLPAHLCWIGEPTSLKIANGHKGKRDYLVTCYGKEGHSALSPKGLNAIYLATDLINAIRAIQADKQANGPFDDDFEVPYSTLHVGVINAGTAINIVPNQCQFRFETRTLVEDDPAELLAQVQAAADQIVVQHQDTFPEAGFEIAPDISYPGLNTPLDSEAITFLKSLTGSNDTIKVAFGTEGGLFSEQLGFPTVVCGPGSMDQGHKADEFIALSQMQACDALLDRLLERLM